MVRFPGTWLFCCCLALAQKKPVTIEVAAQPPGDAG